MESLEITVQDLLKLCEKRPDIGLLVENVALKRKIEELALELSVAHGLTNAMEQVQDNAIESTNSTVS